MKKLLLILLCLPLLFSTCKKDDEVTPTNTNNTGNNNTGNNTELIIGAWTINTVVLESDTSSSIYSPDEISIPSALDFVSGGILYETFSNELDTNEWVIIADSLYIGDGGEDLIAKHQVTNTNLTLVGPLEENMLGFTTLTINGTRD
tara:strand:- start:38 stop:478 length:441 start_codon:yes stop_codon:yes gene_type:complete